MDGHLARVRHRSEELLDEVGVEIRDPALREVAFEGGEGPTRDVDRAGGAGLVHRYDGVPEAPDAGAVAERLVESLSKREAGVLDGVVRPGFEVAASPNGEIENGVAGESVQQMVEEAHAGLAHPVPDPIEV
jgi:hypothetical protein